MGDQLYLLLLGCVLCISLPHVDSRSDNNKFRSLRSDRMKNVADISDMDYFMDQLLAPMMRTRVSGSEGNKIVQQHIMNYMRSYGWSIEEDTFTDDTPMGPKEFNNIVATLNPTVPHRLVLACHFDSKYFANFEFIGATDSAVPCAMMLDLARLMNTTLWKSSDKLKSVTLQFVFFDGEEAFKDWTQTDSIYGARHLAEKWANTKLKVERENEQPAIDTVTMMVLLDLIGTKGTTFRNWFGDTSKAFERLQKVELKLGREGLLAPASDFQNRKSNKYFIGSLLSYGGIEDDHVPFLHKNVPILHIISYPFPDVWHNARDNEAALDRTTIDNLNKILRVFVAEYLHLSP